MASAMASDTANSDQRTAGGVGRKVVRAPAESVTYERRPTTFVFAT